MGELLEALSRAGGEGDDRLTAVAMRVNLPYDRLQQYLGELRARGLVEASTPFRLTAAGRRFLESYRQWRESLRLFGMAPEE